MMKISKLNLKIDRLVESIFVGNYKAAFVGKWVEFSSYRWYVEWDDVKNIDFATSQKEGKILVKQFQELRELKVFFFLDLSSSMNFSYHSASKKESLLEVFLYLCYAALKNNDSIGAILFDETWYQMIGFGKWKKHIWYIQSEMEKQKKERKWWHTGDVLKFFNSTKISKSLVFFLTDKMNFFEKKDLHILGHKNDGVYINIFNHFENNLSYEPTIQKIAKGSWYNSITLFSKKKILAYQKLRQDKIFTFHKLLKSLKISHFTLDERSNIYLELLKFFRSH